ncbi:MAG: PQQ-dependent sugar dehydrogenase, partial [Chloroflexi bacterium]|nr:PQQ-dependent sugar dehydrogenase [Chloroflexota bacterium]
MLVVTLGGQPRRLPVLVGRLGQEMTRRLLTALVALAVALGGGWLLAAGTLGLSTGGPTGAAARPPSEPELIATVIRVIDGESVEGLVQGRRTAIGYLGLAAPYENQPCGLAAKARNQELAGRQIRLQADPAYGVDEIGRRLFYAFTADGESIEEILIREGYARAARTDASRGATLLAIEEDARLNQRGCLWSPDGSLALRVGTAASHRKQAVQAAPVPTLAPGFIVEDVEDGFTAPTAFAATPDGRIFVTEQAGRVRVIKNGATLADLLIDLSAKVNSYWDRGLLGIAVDPNFATNGYVYLSYVYENNPAAFTGPKSIRVSRFTVIGDVADPASELPLLGSVVAAGCGTLPAGTDCMSADSPSHTAGSLKFASDGTLFVMIGDGAIFTNVDERALRAQSLDILNGKLLRITTTGQGVATNPFWNGNASANRSKVYAYGLRNSLRFNFRPGTDTLYLGEVGWNDWEEINVALPGANFGWPCYEGEEQQPGYAPYSVCQALYAQGTSAIQWPVYTYAHNGLGASAIGGPFYPGTAYPSEYQGAYFFGDYSLNHVKYFHVDEQNQRLDGPFEFATEVGGVVNLEIGPDGNLWLIAYTEGALRRYRYAPTTNPNGTPPTVTAVSPANGATGVKLASSVTATFDAAMDTSTLTSSTVLLTSQATTGTISATVSYVGATRTVTLVPTGGLQPNTVYTVTIKSGASGAKDIAGTALAADYVWSFTSTAHQAPTVAIVAPDSSFRFQVGQTVAFSATATDYNGQAIPAGNLSWKLILHHCVGASCHLHPFIEAIGASGTFVAPDHDDGSYAEAVLTATDGEGQSTTVSQLIRPQEVELTFTTSPAGRQLVYGGATYTAPLTRTAIVGATRSVSVPSPQSGQFFLAWSDGGAATHNIVIPAALATYTATLGSPASVYAEAVLVDQPLGYWRLDETSGTTATDLTGNNNAGSYVGGVTLGVSGTVASEPTHTAVQLDGATGLVSVPSTSGLSPTSAVSVEAWVYVDAYSGTSPAIVSKSGSFELNLLTTGGDQGRLRWRVYRPTAFDTTTAAADALQLQRWYHVVATFDGVMTTIYLDGVLVAGQVTGGQLTATAPALTFGRADQPFAGRLDEVALYGTALSAARIEAHLSASGAAAPTAPVVANVSPRTGLPSGGANVTLSGARFTGATDVRFGTTSATFTVVNGTTISATTPAHVDGAVDVTVTTPAGTSRVSGVDLFTYRVPAPPTVTAVSPTSGPATGGTAVTISGTSFLTVTQVSFGGTPASTYTVQSGTELTAVSPAHSVGAVDVRVTNSDGQSAITAADQFTYTAVVSFALSGTVSGTGAEAISGATVTAVNQTTAATTIATTGSNGAYSLTLLSGSYTVTVTASGYVAQTQTVNLSANTTRNVTLTQLAPGSAYASAVLADQPLAYWRLDEASGTQAADLSGNAFHGAYSGTVTLNQSGALNTEASPAPRFDGASGHVVAPNGFSSFVSGLTIEAWIYPTATGFSERILDFGNGQNADNILFGRVEATNNLRYEVYNGAGSAGSVVATNALVLNTWQHVAVTVSSIGGATIYRNGQVVATGSVPLPPNVNRTKNYVGRSNWAGDAFFQGRLDEVALYPSALSATRIQAHYSVGARPGAPTGVTATAGNGQATVTWTAPTALGGNTPLTYTVTSSGGQSVSVPGVLRAATIAGLTNGKAYTFAVTALNEGVTGQASTASNAVTPLATAGTLYPSAVLTDQPLAYWRLGETSGAQAGDSSGNAQHAAYSAGVTLNQAGALSSETSSGVALDGASGHVVAPNGFSSFATGLTVEAWIYPTANGWSARIVDFGNGQGSDNVIFSRREDSNDLKLEIYQGGSSAGSLVATGVLTPNAWQHVAVTLSPTGSATIYRNGQAVATGAVPLPLNVTRTQNYVGRSNWAGDAFFQGRLDEVAVYPTALGAARLLTHYQAAVVPGAPTNVVAAAGNQQATVSWTAPTATGSGAILTYTVTSSGGQTKTVTGTVLSTNVTGLTNGTAYTFTITAANATGSGPASAASNVVTPSVPVSSAYASAVLTDLPVAYWRLGETSGPAVDSSGNGYHGVYSGTVTLNQSGALRSESTTAAGFDGTNGHVVVPSGFADFSGGLTLEAWAYPTANGWSARIVDFGNGQGS